MTTFFDLSTAVYTGLVFDNGFYYRQARYITAQSAHETAGFTSKIFKENNNLFGMKLALVRKTTATGEKYGHAVYPDIESSIKDFELYFKANKYNSVYNSIDDYVKALKKKNYFEAPETEYLNGVKAWYQKIFTNE